MSTPHEILAELLSSLQADVLDRAGRASWEAAAATLSSVLGTAPAIEELEGRLIMPDEVIDDFADPHIVIPFRLSTNRDQSAIAYGVGPTAAMARFFGSQADSPEAEEQQTIVIASALLGQVTQAVSSQAFAAADSGLAVSLQDITANSMPSLLSMMDEPALALTGVLKGDEALPVTFLFPGTFLDIIAGAMQAAASAPLAAEPVAVPAPASPPPTFDLPFSLTSDELTSASLIDEEAAGAAETGAAPEAVMPAAGREPTPIMSAPTAHRARFAPLPDPEVTATRQAIDLLSGLEMNVSVELGRTEMKVSEVLNLGPGSVIELDRLSGEPVDILVNDRLIARGEVVVVDENFGVRVVEVIRRGVEHEERVS